MRSTAWLSETDFNRVNLEAVNNNKLGKVRSAYTLLCAKVQPAQSETPWNPGLYLAGANRKKCWTTNTQGPLDGFDRDWMFPGIETSHFQYGGGLNLRGYAGYLGAQTGTDGNVYNIYNGLNGASAECRTCLQPVV